MNTYWTLTVFQARVLFSSESHRPRREVLFLSSLYRCENGGSERLSDLLGVTELIHSRTHLRPGSYLQQLPCWRNENVSTQIRSLLAEAQVSRLPQTQPYLLSIPWMYCTYFYPFTLVLSLTMSHLFSLLRIPFLFQFVSYKDSKAPATVPYLLGSLPWLL